jgi:hypothetical protein
MTTDDLRDLRIALSRMAAAEGEAQANELVRQVALVIAKRNGDMQIVRRVKKVINARNFGDVFSAEIAARIGWLLIEENHPDTATLPLPAMPAPSGQN